MTIDIIIVATFLLVFVAVLCGATWAMRDRLRNNDIKKRFAVTLKGKEGEFAGLLVEESWRTLTFEDCVTVPTKLNEPVQPIPGRVHVDRANVAYRQELPNDSV
jgi:hypothetical protein